MVEQVADKPTNPKTLPHTSTVTSWIEGCHSPTRRKRLRSQICGKISEACLEMAGLPLVSRLIIGYDADEGKYNLIVLLGEDPPSREQLFESPQSPKEELARLLRSLHTDPETRDLVSAFNAHAFAVGTRTDPEVLAVLGSQQAKYIATLPQAISSNS